MYIKDVVHKECSVTPMQSTTVLVIPARFGSQRFPGKPLVDLAGLTLLQRAINTAKNAVQTLPACKILVATDDARIMWHAIEQNVEAVLTPESCRTGTDRVLAAVQNLAIKPELILNLQGDVPFLPSEYIQKIILAFNDPEVDIATPVLQLTWQELDILREAKKVSPFSGTAAILDNSGYARWFSKNIIPAIRNEDQLRSASSLSPVYKHIGLYAYKYKILEQYIALDESHYEKLEGLEQLRAIENGMKIKAVEVTSRSKFITSGIDSQADADRFCNLIRTYGEPEYI
jgi:3-deoxy-manno-octulosonate cytidylyltransferase (CMP-KDO synthetase)